MFPKIKIIFKVLFIVIIFYLLFTSGKLNFRDVKIRSDQWFQAVTGSLFLFFAVQLSGFRQWLLFRIFKPNLCLLNSLAINWSANFVGVFTIGVTGVDAVLFAHYFKYISRKRDITAALIVNRFTSVLGLMLTVSIGVVILGFAVTNSFKLMGVFALAANLSIMLICWLVGITLAGLINRWLKLMLYISVVIMSYFWSYDYYSEYFIYIYQVIDFKLLGVPFFWFVLFQISVFFGYYFILGCSDSGFVYRFLKSKLPFGENICFLLDSLYEYNKSPFVLVSSVFLALVVQFLSLCAIYFCVNSVLVEKPSFLQIYVSGAMGIFTSVLPLPGAGIGIGEAAFGATLTLISGGFINEGVAAYLVYRILGYIVMLGGGIMLLRELFVVKSK